MPILAKRGLISYVLRTQLALFLFFHARTKISKRWDGLHVEQVAKVVGVVIPLSMIIGFCEECAFRGLLPLIIAAKTGLPTAGVVLASGIIFGVSCCSFSTLCPFSSLFGLPSSDVRPS